MKTFLTFCLVIFICFYSTVGVYGKSNESVNKHRIQVGSHKSKEDQNVKVISEQNQDETNNSRSNRNSSSENAKNGEQIASKITHDGKITTEDYLKSLNSAEPIQDSEDIKSNSKLSNSAAGDSVGGEREKIDEDGKKYTSVNERKENLTEAEKLANEKNKSNIIGKISKSNTGNTTKNKEVKDLEKNNSEELKKNASETKTVPGYSKQNIDKSDNLQGKIKFGNSGNKTNSTGGKQKKAKKLLVTFFRSEVDEDGDPHAKKTHVTKENEHEKQGTRNATPNTQHAGNLQEKKSQVMKEDVHGEQSTRDDSPYTHTKDEELTLAEISDKVYKRTGLLTQPQVTKLNNKVIETVLPSGRNVEAPQHIRLSSEPTHVVFKPVHKYYPAIHRYMTKPIHRYLNKPVDLSDLNPPLQGQGLTTSPPVKQATSPVVIQRNVGIPQAVANNLLSAPRGNQLQVKQYASPPGQQVPAGLVNRQTPALNMKQFTPVGHPRIIPGGLPHAQHVIPGNLAHIGPVRVFSQMPPRIQPVLIHPNRLSPTG